MYITMGISPLTSSKSKEKNIRNPTKVKESYRGKLRSPVGIFIWTLIVLVFLCVRCVLRSPLWDFFSPHVHLAVNV